MLCLLAALALAEDVRPTAVSVGASVLTDDPEIQQTLWRGTLEYAASPHVRLELSGAWTPDSARWKVPYDQVIAPLAVSSLRVQAHGAVRVIPLAGTLGPFRFEAGLFAGLGLVHTEDTAWADTGEYLTIVVDYAQTQPSSVWGGLFEIGGSRLRARFRAQRVHYVETRQAVLTERVRRLLLGPELTWWF